MALEVYNPSHPNASSGWVALTAANPWPLADVLHIRDTALALSGGVAETAVISLPGSAEHMIYGLSGANGTVTAGALEPRWQAKGVTYGANLNPEPAGATAAAIDAVPRSVADTNEYGIVAGYALPETFTIKATGIVGTATTLNLSLEVHRT
jgi:hypothetical protein